jgi:hypothetical protein
MMAAMSRLFMLSVLCAETASLPVFAQAPVCVPGTQIECACIGGTKGVQVCEEGTHYGLCQCAPPPAAAPAPPPPPPPTYTPSTTTYTPPAYAPTATATRGPEPPTGMKEIGAGGGLLGFGLVLWIVSAALWAVDGTECPALESGGPSLHCGQVFRGDPYTGTALVMDIVGFASVVIGAVFLPLGLHKRAIHNRWRASQVSWMPQLTSPSSPAATTALASPLGFAF